MNCHITKFAIMTKTDKFKESWKPANKGNVEIAESEFSITSVSFGTPSVLLDLYCL